VQHEHLLEQVVTYLQNVPGLKAVALGGSYTTGSQLADSDSGLGLCLSKCVQVYSRMGRWR
jgi:hypothetical protein